MDENSLRSDKAGRMEWSDNGQFCYFMPNALPLGIGTENFTGRSLRTVSGMSRLDGRISNIPHGERFVILNSFAIKEATATSAIEGTRSTVSDIFKEEKEKETDAEKALDNQEVRNYKDALIYAIEAVSKDGTITENIILSMHNILLKGVRGGKKLPGSYRNGQVWVGGRKDTLETAEFVPVPPFAIQYMMDNLIEYMNNKDEDPVRKMAVSHYQFETIHPFTDGNGRIGRLILMLLAYKEGIMDNPFLYISEYFNKYRDEYIRCLMNVRTDGDLAGWMEFLLDALDAQTKMSSELFDSLSSYRNMMSELALKEGIRGLDAVCGMLIENPFITVNDVVRRTGVSAPTARKLLNVLISNGILDVAEGKRKGVLYRATAILDMLENS